MWSFFGKEFSIAENGGQWDKIARLPEVGSLCQLKFAMYMPLPTKIKLSIEQQKQLQELDAEVSRKRRLQIFFSEVDISSQLNSVLSIERKITVGSSLIGVGKPH